MLLAVGRLTVQKDLSSLLKAFAKVRERQSARLMILGEGPDRAILENQVEKLNLQADVALPGFVDNPYSYMSRAAVYVMSSRWEGLPTVLIEALYCGASIVSTDCPSGPNEILAGGKYGKLVPVGDVTALAKAIETSLTNKMSSPGRSSWYHYSLEGIMEQYLDLLLGE